MTEPCCEHWNKFKETLEWEVDDETNVWYNPTWGDVHVKFCPFCGSDGKHSVIRF